MPRVTASLPACTSPSVMSGFSGCQLHTSSSGCIAVALAAVLAGFAVVSRSRHPGDSHHHPLSCRSRLPPAAPARVRVRWLCLRCRAVVRCACVCVLRLSSPSPSRWLLFSACPRHLARWASSTALPTCCRPPEPAGIPYIPQWMHLPSSVSPRRARGHARGTSRRPCGRLKFSAVSWRAPLQ